MKGSQLGNAMNLDGNAKHRMVKLGLLFACSIASYSVSATTAGYWTKVTSLIAYPGAYGGCYASVAIPLSAAGKGFSASCNDSYVAFNCEGLADPNTAVALNTKADGLAKFNQATIAHVTKASMYVTVDDQVRLNGICYAKAAQVSIPQ